MRESGDTNVISIKIGSVVRHDRNGNLHSERILHHLAISRLKDVIRKCDFLEKNRIRKGEEEYFIVHKASLGPYDTPIAQISNFAVGKSLDLNRLSSYDKIILNIFGGNE